MNVEEKYTELYQTLLKEHKEVFEKQDVEELSKFMDLICKADRIFLKDEKYIQVFPQEDLPCA